MYIIVVEVSNISGTICPLEGSLSMLAAIEVLARILSTISPNLKAISALLVAPPLSGVFGAILVEVGPLAMSLISHPFTIIDIAVGMQETTTSMRHVIGPSALVACSIGPNLNAVAAPPVLPVPASDVRSSTLECEGGLSFQSFQLCEGCDRLAPSIHHFRAILWTITRCIHASAVYSRWSCDSRTHEPLQLPLASPLPWRRATLHFFNPCSW
mmetsp:Transcript_46775/g.109115  ORF Transcript_46775/g.109115 Transcript_46775/m.109115 type:complete len:213 (-) Transcript_46775:20-658(-)